MPVPLASRLTRSSAAWGRAGAALVLVGAVAATPAATSDPGSAASAATAVRQGTLMSAVDRTKSESNAGIKQAMVEVGWDWVQPKSATAWNTAGLKEVRADVLAHRAAGRRVTLGFAVHETPAWAFTLPDARSIDNHGARSGDLNVVFSQSVRNATAAYMRKVLAAVGPANIDRIRITSGGSYELLYPRESYFSYGRITAAGMPAQPRTGRPGTRSTKAQHHAWARWYVGGLANVANWQMSVANAAGFRGTYEILMPGSGVRPSAWSAATSRHLPDGLLGPRRRLVPDRPDAGEQVAREPAPVRCRRPVRLAERQRLPLHRQRHRAGLADGRRLVVDALGLLPGQALRLRRHLGREPRLWRQRPDLVVLQARAASRSARRAGRAVRLHGLRLAHSAPALGRNAPPAKYTTATR